MMWNDRLYERIEALLGDRPGQTALAALRQRDKAALKDEFYPRFYRNETLDSDVVVNIDAAWFKVLSLRLTTGVWMVHARATVTENGGSTVNWFGRLYDAANSLNYGATQIHQDSSAGVHGETLAISAVVRVREDHQPVALDFDVAVDANAVAATTTVRANLTAMGNPDKATALMAWRMV